MFTGLIQGLGEIKGRRPKGGEFELTVEAAFDWSPPLELGESVAVSGVCLTVAAIVGRRGFTAHASGETLSASILGEARAVNLERALALGGRLGGHLVSGHVDGRGRVESIAKAGASLVFKFAAPPDLAPFIVPKGSICVDGVSLTVNEAGPDFFTVNLIPHSAQATTLGSLKPGRPVNLETDLIGKYVHSFLSARENSAPEKKEGLSLEFLARHGF